MSFPIRRILFSLTQRAYPILSKSIVFWCLLLFVIKSFSPVTDIPLAESRRSTSGRGFIDSFPNSVQIAAFISWFLRLYMMGFSEGHKTVCTMAGPKSRTDKRSAVGREAAESPVVPESVPRRGSRGSRWASPEGGVSVPS